MLTPEQFAEWKTHPVTIEIFSKLKESKQDLESKLSEGRTLNDKAEITHGLTNKIVGQIEGLNQLLNITFEDSSIIEDVNEVSGY